MIEYLSDNNMVMVCKLYCGKDVNTLAPDAILDDKAKMFQDSIAWTEKLESPRIIKSHLPISMLPPNILNTAKILYVGR